MKAELIKNTSCELGEGCIWDEKRKRLYFVDILGKKIHCYEPNLNCISSMEVTDLVGTIVLYEDGSLLAMEKDKFFKIDFDTKKEKLLYQLKVEDGLRFNDGKCDFNGRIWVGTMAIDQDKPNAKKGGSLYCFEEKGSNSRNPILQKSSLPGYTIPNGLAWSSDCKKFYHIDTPEHAIDCYDILENGEITNRSILISMHDVEGSPDGMTIDSEGNLWVAMWGGNKVICYEVQTGKILEEIQLPERFVTCCTFGGDDMQTLFITTAKNGQSEGGNLYSVHLKKKGLAPNRIKDC